MNVRFATALIRTLGTLVGLLGVALILCVIPAVVSLGWVAVAVVPILALIGGPLIYVGYAAWRRLSPRTVVYVCVVSGLLFSSFVLRLVGLHPDSTVADFARFLVTLGGAYMIYH